MNNTELRPETAQFLKELEQFSKRKLSFAWDVGVLIDLAKKEGKEKILEEAVFLAKFIHNSYSIMQRIGREGEGYTALAAEFESSVEKISALLKTLIAELSEATQQYFLKTFFVMDQESFQRFLALLDDLSWVKNWLVDGKKLP